MFTLDHVVPWGRSFDEYRAMFGLSEADLDLRVLGCGDGPASFNAVATRRGATVVSCDPIYRWSAAEIQSRIEGTHTEVGRFGLDTWLRTYGPHAHRHTDQIRAARAAGKK